MWPDGNGGTSMDWKTPCLGGCGKRVMNRTGMCNDCRKVKCKGCKELIRPNEAGETRCHKCRQKYRKLEEGKRWDTRIA